jgi:predicted MFS family arabinose efflux permease
MNSNREISMQRPWPIIAILAFTQILSWGALYYAFSILAPAMGQTLGMRAEIVYGAFSWSLLVAGLVATPTGMLLDRFGGQWVMASGSLVCGLGLIWLSKASGPISYFGAWSVLGVAMSLTLYEAAFATINRKFHQQSRQAISTLTLFAGFASTIFWPLTLALNTAIGWRDTYLWFGIAQLLVCLPLHLMMGRDLPPAEAALAQLGHHHTLAEALRHRAFWKLAIAFAANMFIFSALSVHLIPLLQDFGHAASLAVLMSTLIGPMQVVGRLCERTFARKVAPQNVGMFAFGALPAAVLALLMFGSQAWAVSVFCVLYGLSNGILTIVRGTIPQAMFGRKHYGAISGAMAGPSLLAKAAGPLVAAAILRHVPAPAPFLYVLLSMALVSLAFYIGAVRVRDSLSAPLAEPDH